MRRMASAFSLAFLALVVAVPNSPAGPIGPPSIQDQVTQVRNFVSLADLVVVGKVKAIEEKTIVAAHLPTDVFHFEHKVAVIAVEEVVLGDKNVRKARVAFKAVYSNNPVLKATELILGENACFALKKHHELDLFIPLWKESKDNPNFERDVTQAKRTARCLKDIMASLKSKEAEDRLVAASLLINRYRTIQITDPESRNKRLVQEPIDAEESKLILMTLAESDWSLNRDSVLPAPSILFSRLGVMVTDGLRPPANFAQYNEVAKAWLKENTETYRVKRWVWVENTKQ